MHGSQMMYAIYLIILGVAAAGKPSARRAPDYNPGIAMSFRTMVALLLGLAHEWAPDASWPVDSLEVRDPDGRPLANASVSLGAAFVLLTGADGRIRFERTEPGPIDVTVNHPRAYAHRVLLDSSSGVVLTGSRGP